MSYPNPNEVSIVKDESLILSYTCTYLTSGTYNNFSSVTAPAYYNLAYPCNSSPQVAKDLIRQRLLEAAATTWSLVPDGEGCTNPALAAYNAMLVAVSLDLDRNDDAIVDPRLLSCDETKVDLTANAGICCTVVKTSMDFTPQGGYDAYDFMRFMADQLDSTQIVKDTPYQTAYEGSFLPPQQHADTIETNTTAGAGTTTTSPQRDGGVAGATGPGGDVLPKESPNQFTAIGAVILTALLVAFLGLVFIVVKRKREHFRYSREQDLEQSISKAELELKRSGTEYAFCVNNNETHSDSLPNSHDNDNDNDNGSSDNQDGGVEVSMLTDDMEEAFDTSNHKNNSGSPYRTTSSNNGKALPHTTSSFDTVSQSNSYDSTSYAKNSTSRQQNYAFDLGQAFRDNVMGVHSSTHNNNNNHHHTAPTTIEVVPPYPMMEETSDSEVDSWAQTDGTVGSLEDRLEEITAEI